MKKQTLHAAFLKGRLLTLTAILASLSLTLAQPANPADRTGTLTAPAKIPIMANGAQLGATTAPAGTKIKVLKEEAGKLLVSAPAGQAWVDSASVTQDAPTQEATPPSPTQGVGIAATPPNIARAATATPVPPANTNKRILIIVCSRGYIFTQYMMQLIDALKQKGAEITLASESSVIQRKDMIREKLIGTTRFTDTYADKPDIEPDIKQINSKMLMDPSFLHSYNGIVFIQLDHAMVGLPGAYPLAEIAKNNIPMTFGETHPETIEALRTGVPVKRNSRNQETFALFLGPQIKTTMIGPVYNLTEFGASNPTPPEAKMTKFINDLAYDIVKRAK